MSTLLKIKAMLQEEGVESSDPEIRRFSVDVRQGENSEDFHSLLTTVQSVFNLSARGRPTAGSCTLFWKDEDGDLVQFSTTAELHHAIDRMYDDTLRIYVCVTNDRAEANAQDTESEEENKDCPDSSETPFPFFTPSFQGFHPFSWQWPGATPPFMGPGRHWRKKGKKMMKMMWKQRKMAMKENKEFHAVRVQVPATFRFWVRKYVRTWLTQGKEAAAAMTESTPEGAPPGFQQWLDNFLHKWTESGQAGKASSGSDVETRMEEDDQLPDAPEGLPPVYYQWLRHFLSRFARRQAGISPWGDNEEGEDPDWLGRHRHFHKHGFRHGKKHCKHGKKGRKDGSHDSSSSDSDSSDSGHKLWKNVPKEFRKYVRMTLKHQHKNKGDNLKIKEKATRAGLSAEVLEFVQQVLLEWQAKLSDKRPRHVAREMMEGERTLPPGLQKEHFEWLCRFVARWHLRHARKCDVMAGWSSEETTSASSEEEEATAGESTPWPALDGHPFWASMGAMRGHAHGLRGHPHGMRGHPLGMRGHPLGMIGHPQDMRGHPHGMRGHRHGIGGHPHDMRGHPHGMRGHGLRGHPHDMRGHPHGMRGYLPHHFGVNPGMPPPDFSNAFPSQHFPPHFDSAPMPFEPERLLCPGLMMGFGGMPPKHSAGCGAKRGSSMDKSKGCKRQKDRDGSTSGQAIEVIGQEEMERVTEGVRKM